MAKLRFLSAAVVFASFSIAGLGCRQREEITTYSAPKETPAETAGTTPVNSTKAPTESTSASNAQPVEWALPAGWAARQPGAMQYAAFEPVPGDSEVLVTVIPMPGGQPLLPNINRWEGQLGLPQSNQADAQAKVMTFAVEGLAIQRVKLVGESKDGAPASAIDAAFVDRGDQEWFFKLQGRAEKVAAAQPKFEEFLRSLRFGETGTPSATTSTPPVEQKGAISFRSATAAPAKTPEEAPSATAANEDQWTVPATWVAEPEKPMRIASWQTAASGDFAEVIVTRFAVGGFGAMEANINRWRGMVGLAPVQNESEAQPTSIKVGAIDAKAYDFVGTGAEAKRVYVVLVPTNGGDRITFYRLQGSAAAVEQAKADFDRLIQSARVQ